MNELAKILDSHPLFEDLPQEYALTLTSCAQDAAFPEGSNIILSGNPADTFFIIREGIVALEVQTPNSSPLTILTLGEGDVLGWSWIFPPYEWHFDAQAITPIKAIALDARCVRGKCESDHELGYQLMKRLAQVMLERLVGTRLQLLDLYGQDKSPAFR